MNSKINDQTIINNMVKQEKKDNTLLFSLKGIIQYPFDMFKKDIIDCDCCFICGAQKGSKEFNDEHVIPDWLLRHIGLHNQKLTIPNGGKSRYSTIKVKCCKNCNEYLSKTIEKPLSQLLKNNYNDFLIKLNEDIKKNTLLIFKRLSLLFLKLRLNDKKFPIDIKDINSPKLGDMTNWGEIHHLYCIVRSEFYNIKIDKNVIGSLFFCPLENNKEIDSFNFNTHIPTQTIMLKINDIGIIAVLQDKCSTLNLATEDLSFIKKPLNNLQFIELFSHFISLRSCIKNKFKFYTEFNSIYSGDTPKGIIKAKNEKIKLNKKINELVPKKRGDFFYHYAENILNKSRLNKETLNEIKKGKRTFIFSGK